MDRANASRVRRAAKGDVAKLDVDAWTDAALAHLGEHGIDGVRVELLAKRLNVTKGSFYWHFKDRDALLEQMLERWRRRATLILIQRLDSDVASPTDRLRQLLRLPLKGETAMLAAAVELAIRLWGRTDERARKALEEIDELRLQYIARLFVQAGTPEEAARAHAILAYSYQRVAATLVPRNAATLMQQCEDLIIGKK